MKPLKTQAVLLLLTFAGSQSAQAARCGAVFLFETEPPAVLDAVDPTRPLLARFWEAGAGAANRADLGCVAGCTSATAAQCDGGGDCLSLTGITWLNATCATAGHLPQRTIFVLEQTTASTGGRWAAIDLDRNSSNVHTDLDAKAAVVCGGCASELSPLVGGPGYPLITSAVLAGTRLEVDLGWSPPPAAAQALSNGASLVASYAAFYRIDPSPPPPATGDPTGWLPIPDLEADGAGNGGFSTNTSAAVEIDLPFGQHYVSFAIGLSLDGTGNPTADPDTRPLALLSDQSDPVEVMLDTMIFADGFESGDSSAWSSTVP